MTHKRERGGGGFIVFSDNVLFEIGCPVGHIEQEEGGGIDCL